MLVGDYRDVLLAALDGRGCAEFPEAEARVLCERVGLDPNVEVMSEVGGFKVPAPQWRYFQKVSLQTN